MNECINLTLENIDEEHICCAIGDKKHQAGVDAKKEWIKNKLKDVELIAKCTLLFRFVHLLFNSTYLSFVEFCPTI